MGISQFLSLTSTGAIPNVGIADWFTTGTLFFVDSNNGAATNNGLTPGQALTTLSAALALCTANKGDIVFLMPGHAETLSAELSISTEGVSVIGLGNGDNKPVITADNTATSLTLAADNLTLFGIVFQNDVDSQVEVIDIADAQYARVEQCQFIEGSSKQYLLGISITNAGADNVVIKDCELTCTALGANSAIKIGVVVDRLTIEGCTVIGDYADACIHNPIGNIATNLIIRDCFLKNDNTGEHSIELVSACTGALIRNYYHNDMAQATGVDPGSCHSFECYHCDAIDVSGILAPAAT